MLSVFPQRGGVYFCFVSPFQKLFALLKGSYLIMAPITATCRMHASPSMWAMDYSIKQALQGPDILQCVEGRKGFLEVRSLKLVLKFHSEQASWTMSRLI